MRPTARQAHLRLAMFLGLFIVVHFATHLTALAGIARHDAMLELGRVAYRIPVIETLLILAFAAQIGLGITLLRTITRRRVKGFWYRAQVISATILAVFITLHTSAAIIARCAFALDTNFYWAAGTLTLSPLKYGFALYYAVAIIALVTHVIAALHFRRPKRWHKPALMLGPVIALPILLAYGGALFRVELPEAHQRYFDVLINLI